MSSISSINNNYDNFRISKLTKLEDSKMDSYVFRKQINYSISSCFIPKEVQNIPSNVSTLKTNKSQVEELQKLMSEISYVEEKIRDLEQTKKLKIIKVKININID